MSNSVPLEEVARRTGQSEQRLRRWCATGLLQCEPDGGSWDMDPADIPKVHVLADGQARLVRARSVARTRGIVLIVPQPVAFDLAKAVERHLGLPPRVVATAELAIDGQEYVVATWPSAQSADSRSAVATLASVVGGELLEVGAEAV